MKAHIGVDADSGLVHTVVGTAANVNDATQAHEAETNVLADAGYQGVDKRAETQGMDVNWLVAMRPGKRTLFPCLTSWRTSLNATAALIGTSGVR